MNEWNAKAISVWEYMDNYAHCDDVRLIKGTERKRLIQVLVRG